MKNFILVAIVLMPSILFSQKAWERGDLSRLGYRQSYITADFAGYDMNQDSTHNLYPSDNISIGSVPLKADIFGGNVYFHMDASILTLAIQALAFPERVKEKSNGEYGDFSYLEALPVRLGFGGTFAKYFGLYAGAQWMYSGMVVEPHNNLNQGVSGIAYHGAPYVIGGNQRGFSGHFMFGTDRFLIKYSGLYDWIRRDKKAHKGNAITHEINLFIPFGSSGAGLFASYYTRTRWMEATADSRIPESLTGYYTQTNDTYPLPAFSGTDTHITIGLYAEGLMSGTARTVSQTAVIIGS